MWEKRIKNLIVSGILFSRDWGCAKSSYRAQLKLKEAGTNHGIELLKQEESRMSTNFIR